MIFSEQFPHKRTSILFFITFCFLFSLLFSGCGNNAMGYGVVLLSPSPQDVSTGLTVKLLNESDLNETYEISPVDSNERFQLDTWRIKVFEEQKAAEDWAAEYQEYVNIFARNLRDGLAVREEPSIQANRVYKLRPDQEIKIIEKSDKQETIGGHDGSWYKVLTKDGVQGYCFDYYLEIFDSTVAPEEQKGPDLSAIKEMLQREYRPESFQQMIDNRQIRLDRLTSEYGLFADMENQEISIVLQNKRYSFDFSTIKKTGDSRYLFMPDELELIVRGEDTLQAVFTDDDLTYDPVFVYIEQSKIEEVREAEMQRREEQFAKILDQGPVYTSSAYGNIRFMEGKRFDWQDLDRLVPGFIPNSAYREGTVSFDHFLADSLRGSYSGVLSLRFDQSPQNPIRFLYSLEGNSLKLEYIPEKNIRDSVVLQRSNTPLIMVFFN